MAEVAEQLQVVLDRRIAPDLHRVGHGGVAGGDEGRRVGPLHAAVRRVGVAVLQAEVGEPAGAEREADVAGKAVGVAVAGAVRAGVELEAAPRRVVLQQKVQHAGNRVRAVLRGGAVAQHLDLPQGDRRDGRDVRTLRAVRHPGEPGDDRRAMAALAVDQHQRVVVGEVADAGRPHQRGRVADRVGGDVERGDQGPQLVVEGGGPLAHDVLERDGVDRHLRLGDRPGPGAAAEDDHPLGELDRHLDVEGGRRPRPHRHAAADDGLEAGQGERDLVGARLEPREGEPAGRVGGGGQDRAAGGAARLDGDAGQDESGGVGDGAGDGAVLGEGRRRGERRDGERQRNDGKRESLSLHGPLPPFRPPASRGAETAAGGAPRRGRGGGGPRRPAARTASAVRNHIRRPRFPDIAVPDAKASLRSFSKSRTGPEFAAAGAPRQ